MENVKYNVMVFRCGDWETIAEFDERVELDSIQNFCVSQFDCGNSLALPCEDIVIVNALTGEILWDYEYDFDSDDDDDEFYDEYDIDEADLEIGYNPYLGGYDYDC